jgi:hypothetical protein
MGMGTLHTGFFEYSAQTAVDVCLVGLRLAYAVPEEIGRIDVAYRRRHAIER